MRPVYLTVLLLLCAAATRPAPAIAQGPLVDRSARVQTEVREILSGPGFAAARRAPTLWDRFMQWAGNLWERFWGWLGRLFGFSASSGVGQVFFWCVLAAIIVVMAWAIAYVVRRYALGRPSERSARPAVDVSEVEESGSTEPQEWLEAARRFAAAGEFRRAYRAVFVALLLRLDRAGALKFDLARTNGDYVRALRPRPPLYDLFRPLANAFDARWYGRASATEEDYKSSLAAYQQAEELADGGSH